jgi:hypothetical protein
MLPHLTLFLTLLYPDPETFHTILTLLDPDRETVYSILTLLDPEQEALMIIIHKNPDPRHCQAGKYCNFQLHSNT